MKEKEVREIIEETKLIENKLIKIDEYYKGKLLGKGGFAKCYEFESKEDGKIYAGKIISKNMFNEKTENEKDVIRAQRNKEGIQKETETQKSLKHPKIVKVKTFFEDEQNVYIILEKCVNGTLDDLLKKRKHLTEIEVQCYMFQLIQGLKYIHNKKFVHRDLKPSNIFLDEKLELKIGDFGLVKKISKENDKIYECCGTVPFMAPEIFNLEKGYSFEVDIWAIGVIMFLLLTGQYPFTAVKNKIKKFEYEFPDNIKISEAAKDLIKQILNINPLKRPCLSQILYHDFFHNCKFPELLEPSTLNEADSSSLFKKYNENLDENEVMNKEVQPIFKKLYKLKISDIIEIEYNKIDTYVLVNQSELESFDYWISYFHYSTHYKFFYYEVNNGLFGFISDEDDKTQLVFDSQNSVFYNIIRINGQDEEEDFKIEKYKKKDCPEELEEKLEELLNYNKKKKQKIEKKPVQIVTNSDESLSIQKSGTIESSISQSIECEDNKNSTEKESNENDDNFHDIKLIYIRKLQKESLADFLLLSDFTKQIIYHDKAEIILSDYKPNLVYVDRHKERTIIPIFNILNNSSKELIQRLKYMKKISIKGIKQRMEIKYKKVHPDYDENKNNNNDED